MKDRLLRGAFLIGAEVSLTKEQAYRRLEQGRIKSAWKDGRGWVASQNRLRREHGLEVDDDRRLTSEGDDTTIELSGGA